MRPDSSTLIRLRCVVVAGATACAVDHLKMADEEKAPVVSVTTQHNTTPHCPQSLWVRRRNPTGRSGNTTPKTSSGQKRLVASRLRDSAVFTLAARLSDQVSPTCPLAPSPRLPKLTKTRTGRCCGNTLADGMGK